MSNRQNNLLEQLSKEEIQALPSWIQENLSTASLTGKHNTIIELEDGRKYSLHNHLNHLCSKEWTYFLNSVITTRYPTKGDESYAYHIRKIHPSPKPPQLMQEIIEFFTKEGESVLDYFMGVGGTLLGASLCNRKAIGIDLNQTYIDTYKKASAYLELQEQISIHADALEILPTSLKEYIQGESISLLLLDPPYGEMMGNKKSGHTLKKKKDTTATPFSTLAQDLGNIPFELFLDKFERSIQDSFYYLKNSAYIVIFMKDMQPKESQTNLYHAQIIQRLHALSNLTYKGMKIWVDLNVNLFPYGYPHSFVSNQVHQYILIFKYTK